MIIKKDLSGLGVCMKSIEIELDGELITSVKFNGGCQGMGKAITKLIENKPIRVIIDLLSGIKCGNKKSSCPDLLAKILAELC